MDTPPAMTPVQHVATSVARPATTRPSGSVKMKYNKTKQNIAAMTLRSPDKGSQKQYTPAAMPRETGCHLNTPGSRYVGTSLGLSLQIQSHIPISTLGSSGARDTQKSALNDKSNAPQKAKGKISKSGGPSMVCTSTDDRQNICAIMAVSIAVVQHIARHIDVGVQHNWQQLQERSSQQTRS